MEPRAVLRQQTWVLRGNSEQVAGAGLWKDQAAGDGAGLEDTEAP